MEKWREISGYEGLYEISNLGNVRSTLRVSEMPNGGVREYGGRLKRLGKIKCGYLNVQLWKDGKPKNKLVHLLVAKAFVDNPNTLPIVNHIDENKQNPKADNLEWCTHSYNVKYSNARRNL